MDNTSDCNLKVLFLVREFLQRVAVILGSCLATNFRTPTPRGELVTLVLDPQLRTDSRSGLHTMMHGTTLWNAWHIWRHGFVVGRNGHSKNGSTRYGIWGFEGVGHVVDWAMNRANASSNPSLRKGEFDAWSCPCVIEFRFTVELTRFPDTQAGVCCLTHNGHATDNHRYQPGDIINVQPFWTAFHMYADVYTRYKNLLAADRVRDDIHYGRSIMCSAPWISRPEDRESLVNPTRNPCGRVVDQHDVWTLCRKRGKRFFCEECCRLGH